MTQNPLTQDQLKVAVAYAALAHVVPGHIAGVGTGATANFFIDTLAEMQPQLDISGAVASSEATRKRLEAHGIYVLDLNEVSEMPVCINGADEVDAGLHMIKGAAAR